MGYGKGACGEAQVVDEIAKPSREPDIAHFLLNLRDAAEFKQGLPTSFLSWQTRPLKIDNRRSRW
jgi:hypothetical protein